MKLIPQAEKAQTSQSYQKPSQINGVILEELKHFTGEDGSFAEIIHLENGVLSRPEELAGFKLAQINYSKVLPGTVKAWHFHFDQDEIWFIHPCSQLIVGLLDLRDDSPTKGQTMRLSLGSERCHLLYIPRGVAHGLANPYRHISTMTYLVNNHFNGSDEKRLPYDFQVGAEFWQLKKG